MQGELIPVKEASKILGLKIHTLRRLIKSGEIPAVKLGRRYFLRRRYIEELTGTKTPSAATEGND